jgi:hypothetical protein
MSLWWESLTSVQQGLALFAIPATIVLLIQTLLLLFGLGGHAGSDVGDYETDVGDYDPAGGGHADFHDGGVHDSHVFGHDSETPDPHDISGMRILTVRGFVAFFSVGGWLGIVLINADLGAVMSVFLSVLAGLLSMVALAYFFKWAMRLQEQGNIEFTNAVGKTATVYLPIPARMTGAGKVTVTFQERFMELDAVTKSAAHLGNGTSVPVVEVMAGNILLVEPGVL